MKKLINLTAIICTGLVMVLSHTLTVKAELIRKAWGQGSSNTYILGLNNAVGSAINVYTLKGTEASVIHHTGNYNGINYDML